MLKYGQIKFKVGGRSETECDCWGLVRLIAKENFNQDFPSLDENFDSKNSHQMSSILMKHQSKFEKIEERASGAIVLLRVDSLPCHVGIMLDTINFAHIMEGNNVMIERIDCLRWKNRILAFYKFTGGDNGTVK